MTAVTPLWRGALSSARAQGALGASASWPHLFALSLVGLSACGSSSLFGGNRADSPSTQSDATAELARDESAHNSFFPSFTGREPTDGTGNRTTTVSTDSGGVFTDSGGVSTDSSGVSADSSGVSADSSGVFTDSDTAADPPEPPIQGTITLAEHGRKPSALGESMEVLFRLTANTAVNHDEVVSELENLSITVQRAGWGSWKRMHSESIVDITQEHDQSYVFTALFTRHYYVWDDHEWLEHNIIMEGLDSQIQVDAGALWLFWYDPEPFIETRKTGLFDPNLDSFTLTFTITDRNGLLATNIEQAIQSQPEAFILTGANNTRVVGQQARAIPAPQTEFEHGRFHTQYHVEVTFPTSLITVGSRWSLSLTDNLATPIQDADGHPLQIGAHDEFYLNVADSTAPTIWLEHDTFYLAPEQEFMLTMNAQDAHNQIVGADYDISVNFATPSDFVFSTSVISRVFGKQQTISPWIALSRTAPENSIFNAETVITFRAHPYYGEDYAQLTDTAGNVTEITDVSLTFTINVYERAEAFHLQAGSVSAAPDGAFQATVTVTDPGGFDSPPVFDPTMFRLVPAEETYTVIPLELTGEHMGTPVPIGTDKTQYLLPIQFSLPALAIPKTPFKLVEITNEDPTVPFDLNSAGKIFSLAANSGTISVSTTTRGPAIDASSPILHVDASQLVTITATLADLVGVPDTDLNAITANPSWFTFSLNNQTLAATSVTHVPANPETIYFFDVVFDLSGMLARATNPLGLGTSSAFERKELLTLTFTPTQSIANHVGLTLADTTHLGQFEVIRDTQAPFAMMRPTTDLSVGQQGTVFIELMDDNRLDLTTVSKEDFTITNATGQTLAIRDLTILSDQPRARVQLTVDGGTQAATYTIDVTGEILDVAGHALAQDAIKTTTAQTAQIVVDTSVISVTLESETLLGVRQADRLLDGSLIVRVAVDETIDLMSLARLSASLVCVDDQTTLDLSVLAHEADGDDILVTLGATDLADTDMGLYQLSLSGIVNTTQGDAIDMSARAPTAPIVVAPHALKGPAGVLSVLSPELGVFLKKNKDWNHFEPEDLPIGTTFSLPTSAEKTFFSRTGVNVLATDISGDGKDEWFFGKFRQLKPAGMTARERSGFVEIDLGTPGTAYVRGRSYERLGYHITDVGDVNGDGFADLLIAADVKRSSNPTDTCVRYVIYGGQSWLTDGGVLDLESLTAEFGVRLSNNDGSSLDSYASLGDINNDGYADFAISAMFNSESDFADNLSPHSQKRSAVYVVYGRENLPLDIDLDAMDGVNGAKIYLQDQMPANYVDSIVITTDFNADGMSDVIVAVDNPTSESRDSGFVRVYFGGDLATNHGLKPAQQLHSLTLQTSSVSILYTQFYDLGVFGLNNIGDLNGDGFDDISLYFHESISHLFFLYSSPTWTAGGDREIVSIQGDKAHSEVAQDEGVIIRRVNCVSSAGDLNGDGYDDVFVWRKGYAADGSRLLFGSATGLNYLDPLDGALDGVIDFSSAAWG